VPWASYTGPVKGLWGFRVNCFT